MSVRGFALCLLITASSTAVPSPESSAVYPPQVPYLPGERFVYSVEYGFISAGEASLSVVGIDTLKGIPCYHVQSRAETNPTFSAFFRVNDRVDSYIDMFRLSSLKLAKRLREGKYRKDFEVEFDPLLPLAYYPEGDTLETYPNTQDVLSSLYYLRNQVLEVGKTIKIPHHDNRKDYPLEVRVLRKERIKVPAGKFICYVVEPFLKDVGIFKAKGKILIWLTADEKKMPVLVKTSIFIGSVNAKLERYEEGTPLKLESFSIEREDTVSDESPSGLHSGCIESIGTGGGEDEIPQQDAGPQEDKDLPVQGEEESGQGE
ncbi:MAG: DUF3108 domain-containing protein [Candidatus Glassbacteria bacterium]